MTEGTFNLFTYGSLQSTGSAAHMMQGCQLLGRGSVGGILYDIDGEYRTLVLYGKERIPGDVWRCPWTLLGRLDDYENVEGGLFRRVGVLITLESGTQVGGWVYVAGPQLAPQLTPARRVKAGKVRGPSQPPVEHPESA